MGGGWVGYVFAMFGCVLFVGLVGGSTLLLYGYARVKSRTRPDARVVVERVSSRDDGV